MQLLPSFVVLCLLGLVSAQETSVSSSSVEVTSGTLVSSTGTTTATLPIGTSTASLTFTTTGVSTSSFTTSLPVSMSTFTSTMPGGGTMIGTTPVVRPTHGSAAALGEGAVWKGVIAAAGVVGAMLI
ncbi:uncharacterized protein VTP21DRAFT_6626 [Calcarisporiella thermophila]|uniref:uncharacterized protein n=1 Tax=Calcarisporiella thermophila TaxID=911321 RepID=UPI003742562D